MAFGADELRVLRRALAAALHPVPLADEDVRECLRLADSVDEAVHEAGRLRAFLVSDLGRYRRALPGSAAGYLDLLQEALGAGYEPRADDLAALRALSGNPVAAAVLRRCLDVTGQSVRARLGQQAPLTARVPAPAAEPAPTAEPAAAPAVRRVRLHALPGGRAADEPKPAPQQPRPRPPAPEEKPVPKPSEVFPPRRKPAPPPERHAAG